MDRENFGGHITCSPDSNDLDESQDQIDFCQTATNDICDIQASEIMGKIEELFVKVEILQTNSQLGNILITTFSKTSTFHNNCNDVQ